MYGFISGSQFYSNVMVYVSIFTPVPLCFYYRRFVVYLEVWSPPTLSFFKIVLAIQGPLQFHMNLRVGIFISARKALGILIGHGVFYYPEILHFDVVKLSIFSLMIFVLWMLFRKVFHIPRLSINYPTCFWYLYHFMIISYNVI